MKEIIGDDYPTYEESVNMSLAEQARVRTEDMEKLRKEEKDVTKSNLERLMQENLQLKHRLACIADDIEIIERHICRYDKDKFFNKPSLNADGSIYADEAWANITNIEIACDLSDESVKEWGSPLAEQYRKMLMEK